MKISKTFSISIIILSLILLASAYSLIQINKAATLEANPPLDEPEQDTPTLPPTNTTHTEEFAPEMLSADTTTVSQQGWIDFPYKSADAGHYNLQAGENIAFTWINFPPEAAFYTFAVESNREDQLIIISTDFDSTDGVKVDWNVREKLGGTLVGFACFKDGSCIGTEFSGEIYTSTLPPEQYCSAKLFSIGTVDIYLEPDQNSPILGHMIPGIYSQVYAISEDHWLTIDLANHEYASEEYRSITTGYVPLQRPIELFGPCYSN